MNNADHGLSASFRKHWPEYLMEALELGFFVFMACAASALLRHHASPLAPLFVDKPVLLRLVLGLTMGITFAAIVYSPMGKRSGAHINPAVTLTFFRLGKIHVADAFFYIVFQFSGAILGVALAGTLLGTFVSAPEVNFAATQPGDYGFAIAFLSEMIISALIMGTVLYVTNHKRIMHRSGLYVGLLYAVYITIEQPLSGTSMNPARTVGAAIISGSWSGVWVYLSAPVIGMALAAEAFLWTKGKDAVHCAKLHHTMDVRCIFKCGWAALKQGEATTIRHEHLNADNNSSSQS